MEYLKTISIGGDDDDIYWTLCPGHVDVDTFNKAQAKDWMCDPVTQDELTHEWWIVEGNNYRRVTKETLGAQPFTVLGW